MEEIDFSKIDLKSLACLIFDTLENNNIDAVLVGGACVTIYSYNQYQSYDLDFVTYQELQKVEKALAPLGFKKQGRSFVHKHCPYLIDFVNPPIAVGNQPVSQFEKLKTSSGSLQLLTTTDCIKDRLASYFHWNDLQSLEQALLVAKQHDIDIVSIRKWSENEGYANKFQVFQKKLSTLLM